MFFWVILVAGIFVFLVTKRGKRRLLSRASPPVPSSFPELQGISFAEDEEVLFTDEKFEQLLQKKYGDSIESYFYTTIAGVSHRNDDRTSRKAAIRKCEAFDLLDFVHDEQNAFSKHAMMVLNEEGKQLGFLPDRTAEEVLRHQNKGCNIIGIFRHRNHHPETERVVGAVILVMYLKVESSIA